MTEDTYRYSDLDLDFLPNPITRDVPLKYDVEAVKRSIKNLVFTNKYERPFKPEIDSGINRLLFENFNTIRVVTIQSRIEDVIRNYEPRVTEVSVKMTDSVDRHTIIIDIIFRVRNIPQLESLRIELQRVR